MNRSMKGVLAAATAAVLLLGGGGTLAFWTDTIDVPATTIASGQLDLTAPDCGTGWTLDSGAAYTTQPLVPGDSLSKSCTFTVDAAGEHLAADFDVSAPTDVTGAQALVDELTVASSYTVNGAPVGTSEVPIADGDTVVATIQVSWPYCCLDNDSNAVGGLTATLDAITITATQTHDAA